MYQDPGLWINIEENTNLKAIWNVVKQITEVLKPILWLANWHCRSKCISTKSDVVSLQTRISRGTLGTCSHDLLGDGLRRGGRKHSSTPNWVFHGWRKAQNVQIKRKQDYFDTYGEIWVMSNTINKFPHSGVLSIWGFQHTLNHCTLQLREIVFPPFLRKIKLRFTDQIFT